MKKKSIIVAVLLILVSCSSAPEFETGEIKSIKLLREALYRVDNPQIHLDARKLINREQIDAANIPVLFVELETGQNGTLTPYPGQGIGQTWLGADGATVTMSQGVLQATRGMGEDVMGGNSSMPSWKEIKISNKSYYRKLKYLTGNNRSSIRELSCKIVKHQGKNILNIWDVAFSAVKFEETCTDKQGTIINIYFLDSQNIVRKSKQYHSNAHGYIMTERLDRF